MIVWIVVPPPVALPGCAEYSFRRFVEEHLFCEREGDEVLAHRAWRSSAEWLRSFARLEEALRAPDAALPIEDEDRDRLVAVLQEARIPACDHAALVPHMLAILQASAEMPQVMQAAVEDAEKAMTPPSAPAAARASGEQNEYGPPA